MTTLNYPELVPLEFPLRIATFAQEHESKKEIYSSV